MRFSELLPAVFAAGTAAQSLVDVLSSQSDLSDLVALVQTLPDVLAALGNATDITLLAPSNDALSEFLEDPAVVAAVAADPGLVEATLSYHVIPGVFPSSEFSETPVFPPTLLSDEAYTGVTGGQVVKIMVDGEEVEIFSGGGFESTVNEADIEFTGGVIHIIDAVLRIPQSASETAEAAELTSLVEALEATELTETVDTTPDLTIFAPANAAFDAISNTTESLSTEELSSILQYHVVDSVAYSAALSDGDVITTLNGADVTITINDEGIFVNDAQVVTADVLIANGVVHVIDAVLIPSADANETTTAGTPTATETPDSTDEPTDEPTEDATAAAFRQPAAVGAAALFGGVAVLANF